MNPLRRALSTAVVLAMLLTLTAVPAFAAAVGSATITSGDLLSGQGGLFTVRVTNGAVDGNGLPLVGGSTGGDINAVSIEVPSRVFNANDVTLPSGWGGEYDADIGFVFAWANSEAAAIAPGSSLDFDVLGAARRVADDSSAPVPVFVSDDGGTTLSSAGTPTLTSRILEVELQRVRKPAGAVNTDESQVTAGQDNADVRIRVRNHGSAARTVTIDTNQTGGGSSIETTPVDLSIPAGSAVAGNVDAVFGAAGTVSFEATAESTTGSVAAPLDNGQVTVQQAFAGTYAADSLAPQSVIQGSSVEFRLAVDKTGVQPANLTTTFEVPAIGLSVSSSDTYGAGSVRETIQFPAVTIPNSPNDEYDTTARAVGVDHNGADVDVTITPDQLALDNLVPVVTINANVGMTTVAGADPAAGDGRDITFTGDVQVGSEDGSSSDPCGECTIVLAELRVFDAAGNRIPADLPLDLTNTNGNLTGRQAFTFPVGADTALAAVRVEKPNGTRSLLATSDTFDVDIIDPEIVSAVTGRDTTGDFINVFLSELVDANAVNAADFSVDDNAVAAVTALPQPNGATLLRLDLARTIGENDTPTVTYTPAPFVGQRMQDRVALTVADEVVRAIDGIVPEAPVIQTVNGLGLQDDAYWSNVRQPTVTLAGMNPGDVLFLYYETDGDGVPENGEKVFEGTVSAESATVTLQTALPASDTNGTLIARMFDTVGFGELDSDPLNVDYSDPVIVSFSQTGNQVTVSFNEPLPRGRDAAFDWTVQAGGASRTVTSVSGAGDTRTLEVSASSYDEAVLGPIGGVRFKYRGAEAQRYNDRATNSLANQLATTTG